MGKEKKVLGKGKKPRGLSEPKRARILEVATHMFMEHGFDAVSMEAIADAAPVSKPTLYNHFADKRALFTAVMQRRCEDVFDRLSESLAAHKTVEAALTAMGRQFIDIVLDGKGVSIYRIALTEAQHFPGLGKLFYESGPQRLQATLADYLQRQQRAGNLRAMDPSFAAALFLGMLKSRYQMECLLGLKKDVSAKARQATVDGAVEVFLLGLAP